MNEDLVLSLGGEALLTALLVAGPMLALGLLVGLAVSLFQATTQIQEQTLSFVPKILAVIFAIILWGPWMLTTIVQFTYKVLVNIPYYMP